MALKCIKKNQLTCNWPSIQAILPHLVLKWNTLMANLLSKTALAMVILVCICTPHLYAQESDAINIKKSYPLIFKDFKRQALKSDLIEFFEKNFVELIADIEASITKKEFPALVEFLKTEFNRYAEVLPLKHNDPEELNKWINFKQKEYQCMVLGHKIQNIRVDKKMEQTVKKYESLLKSLLAQLLEVKLEKEQADIEELEKRLDNLKHIHQIRMKSKKKILQNRYDELVGNRQLYQW